MGRTRWLAVMGVVVVGSGLLLRLRWPSSAPALDCPAADVRWTEAGTMWVARCEPGAPRARAPAGPATTLGAKFSLNDASTEDLVLVPGVGPVLARDLLKARSERGSFRSWDEVDAVTGVGPVKLEALKQWTELR